MLKQCLENIGEGLLHACISSKLIFPNLQINISLLDSTILEKNTEFYILHFASTEMAKSVLTSKNEENNDK